MAIIKLQEIYKLMELIKKEDNASKRITFVTKIIHIIYSPAVLLIVVLNFLLMRNLKC